MAIQNIQFFNPFSTKQKNRHIDIKCFTEKQFKKHLKSCSEEQQEQFDEQGFAAKSSQIFIERDTSGKAVSIIAGASDEVRYADGSKIYNAIKSTFSKDSLEDLSFALSSNAFSKDQLERISVGWGWASYSFDLYKKEKNATSPALCLSKDLDKKRIVAFVESVCFIRDLVNIPANDMGPDELEDATQTLCRAHKCNLTSIKDEELIDQNFPMIHDVGRASTRRPRLLDFTWGNEKHPKVTLVGKGVCFDTGGLDIKPSQFMLTMKKDMGGSAHVLGLAHLIMSLNIPIRLRVLIPAVENAVAGNAYRPSDILQSRKGITVEVGNTDAEGRLVLADALTYACEEENDLLIDFATLTGAARIALGYDLPALFSNKDKIAQSLQASSAETQIDDPVWHMPLWKPYRKDLDSPNADISSTGVGRAGATNAALFLQEFIDDNTEWLHIDCYAWEQNGKPGRPKGGADTGMRAVFDLIERRYGK
ncbi:MAG: leucyl aminopeptidase family protein [Alphaproteobacteria bacterium]